LFSNFYQNFSFFNIDNIFFFFYEIFLSFFFTKLKKPFDFFNFVISQKIKKNVQIFDKSFFDFKYREHLFPFFIKMKKLLFPLLLPLKTTLSFDIFFFYKYLFFFYYFVFIGNFSLQIFNEKIKYFFLNFFDYTLIQKNLKLFFKKNNFLLLKYNQKKLFFLKNNKNKYSFFFTNKRNIMQNILIFFDFNLFLSLKTHIGQSKKN
jgi:hypothetical protein